MAAGTNGSLKRPRPDGEVSDSQGCWESEIIFNLCVSCSARQRAGHYQILPAAIKAWRLGVGAELRHRCPQQPLVQTSLHRQRELCPNVSQPAPSVLMSDLQLKQYGETQCMSFCLLNSEVECKDMRLSEAQSRPAKPGVSVTSCQDQLKQLRPKTVSMKTKVRAAPYPQVGLPHCLLIINYTKIFTQTS